MPDDVVRNVRVILFVAQVEFRRKAFSIHNHIITIAASDDGLQQ